MSISFSSDFLTYMLESEFQTYKEVVNYPEGPLWKEAIKSEVNSILQNYTWELVNLPPGVSIWMLKQFSLMEI